MPDDSAEDSEDDGSGSGSGPEDSAEIVPETNPMDGWFPGKEVAQRERDLFDSLGCRDHFMIAKNARTAPMPKDCERLLYSISFLTFQVKLGRSAAASPHRCCSGRLGETVSV